MRPLRPTTLLAASLLLAACGSAGRPGGGDGGGAGAGADGGGEAGQGGADGSAAGTEDGADVEGGGLGGEADGAEGADGAAGADGGGEGGEDVGGGQEGAAEGGGPGQADAGGGGGEEWGAEGGEEGGEQGGGVVTEVGQFRPTEGSYLGGTSVILSGKGLEGVRRLTVGRQQAFIEERHDLSLQFRTPAGTPGLAVVQAYLDGEVLEVRQRFLFLGPSADGGLGDWREDWWDPPFDRMEEVPDDNGLLRMAAVSDGRLLHIAVVGYVLQDMAIIGFVDLDPGEGTGTVNMQDIDPEGGQLNTALSCPLLADDGLGAELAFGTVGMWSAADRGAPQAGWRDVSDPANIRWVAGPLSAVQALATVETTVALPRRVAGTEIAIAVRLVSADGRRLASDTLPRDNPANPGKWSRSYMLQIPDR